MFAAAHVEGRLVQVGRVVQRVGRRRRGPVGQAWDCFYLFLVHVLTLGKDEKRLFLCGQNQKTAVKGHIDLQTADPGVRGLEGILRSFHFDAKR